MATGVIKELTKTNRSYYDHEDVQCILGVSRSKAYSMIREMREKCIKDGLITEAYPSGKIPKKYFDKVCMI